MFIGTPERFSHPRKRDTLAEKAEPRPTYPGWREHEPQEELPEPLFSRDGHELYPVPAIARHLHLTPQHVWALVRDGQIQGRRFGREYAVDLQDALRYRATPRRRPGPLPRTPPAPHG